MVSNGNSSSDNDFDDFALIIALKHHTRKKERQQGPRRQGKTAESRQVVKDLYDGSAQRFQDLFRMEHDAFDSLCAWLCRNTKLHASRRRSVRQKVMIFLYICAQAESQRGTAYFFKISQSSVSSTFKEVLRAMMKLNTEFVTLPEDNYVAGEVELEDKSKEFSGCIGAIDGTHVAAHLPVRAQARFFNRKSVVTQNVFAAVRFDMRFSFILAGAEGSVNDATLYRLSANQGFSIPDGRFYLGDAGFGLTKGVLVPYASTRYHLREFEDGNRPRDAQELYNLRHASLRSVVERAFGALKRKFKILRENPAEYEFKDQIRIIYALTALWNFILECRGIGEEFEDNVFKEDLDAAKRRADSRVCGIPAVQLRSNIAESNWESYWMYLDSLEDGNLE